MRMIMSGWGTWEIKSESMDGEGVPFEEGDDGKGKFKLRGWDRTDCHSDGAWRW